MLVVFLILFTKILANSAEDKYVDLLPDEEKQQFIEKVARRIVKDVESQETGKAVQSVELSEEQLSKHNEFVKAILKQEADYVRRSKGEPTKDEDEKSASVEKDNFGVKHLESEKLAVTDDTDLERVDLTLRHDRREISENDENSTDFIKVEIVTDAAPKTKRSVQIESVSESSENDDITSETYEKTELKTEKIHEVVITSENYENMKSTIEDKDVDMTTTKEPEITTVVSNSNTSNNESFVHVESVTIKTDYIETKNNDSKNEQSNTQIIESTTSGNEGIGQTEPKNSDSSESDEEELEVKALSEHTRRYNQGNETSKTTSKSDTAYTGIEYGVKSMENKTDEYNSVTSTNIKEFSTLANNDSTTTDNIPTTHNIDAFTVFPFSTYATTQGTKKELDTTEYSLNTLTSTLTDEATTDNVVETTSYPPSTEILTTGASTTNHTESISKTVTTTEELKVFVEDFTSKPTNNSIFPVTPINSFKNESHNNTLDLSIQSKKTKPRKQHALVSKDVTTININLDEESIEPTTKRNKPKMKVHKVETVIKLPKKVHNTAITAEQNLKETKMKTKRVKNNMTADKNFIELEKVYYDNNYKVKVGNHYNVYEIPADKSPFIRDEEIVTEQPYYVPIYNYAPNNAYFNPVNRLGPNPEDISQDDVGAFSLVDDMNSAQDINDNIKSQNYDNREYFGTSFDIKRKKFGTKQKLAHSMHKIPKQSDSHEKNRGKVNPEDYLDSDYYFGRVRKYFERRDNNFDQFPNSDEYDHPTHSIQEMSLKDHVRAVRNILFQQKKFGPPDRQGRQGREQNSNLKPREDIKRKPNKLLVKDENSITRIGNNDSKNKATGAGDNNIAIDYYFGRMKPTAVFTSEVNDNVNDKHFQKVGYVKNQNNTKELYVMDDFFKENVVKYLTEIQTKDNTYVKADLMSATPHPMPKMNLVSGPKRIRNESITRFRNEEKKRNAELMRNFQRNQSVNKVERFVNVKGLENIDYLKMRSKVKNYRLKDKISSVRKEVIKGKMNSTKNQEMNLRLNRRNDVVKVGVYVQVLKDMISLDNNPLKQYDWLGTSVDIQSSLQKLLELIDLLVDEKSIHPADLEILRYVLFQQKLATEIIQANDFGEQLRKKLVLPRNKKKKEKHHMLTEKGLINRLWLYLRRQVPEINEDKALHNLNQFLMETKDGLYNLHDAIKNIAKITKYKNQHWYENLKELYLNTDEKQVLELLLHMTVSRLFDLIEDSAKNGLEDGYIQYMKDNKKIAKKTLEEMLFTIQILDEINKIVD